MGDSTCHSVSRIELAIDEQVTWLTRGILGCRWVSPVRMHEWEGASIKAAVMWGIFIKQKVQGGLALVLIVS